MRTAVTAFACTIGVITGASAGNEQAARDARELIGLQYRLAPGILNGQVIAERPSCSHVGGATMYVDGHAVDGWAYSEFSCSGRPIALLERRTDETDGRPTWKIVDTLLLPNYSLDDPNRPKALKLYFNGECELDGKTDTLFFALVRFGKRERIDWRTGVEKAWGFDLNAQRIVPLSTKRIVCHQMEPEE
jgi:hypothetical protein